MAEKRMALIHIEKECEYCKKKFTPRRGRYRWCCGDCRKKDSARIQRERRKKDREEAEAFMRGEERTKVLLSFEQMAKIQEEYNLSYGKIEDAIRCGRIKVEEC